VQKITLEFRHKFENKLVGTYYGEDSESG